MIYKHLPLLVFFCSVFLFSTEDLYSQRRKKRDTDPPSTLGKIHKNVTAKYNGYFNANEMYKAAILNLGGKQTDYNQQLPIFPYIEALENGQKASLEEAIKKLAKVIQRRRKSDWVDDSYLLMGQCRMLMGEYDRARQALLFLDQEYSPEAIKKRYSRSEKGRKLARKEREKERERRRKGIKQEEPEPEKYFLKHRPVDQEAKMNLILVYTLMEKYDNASVLISELERDPTTFPDVLVDLLPIKAYYEQKKGNNKKSIEYLRKAVDEKYSDRQERARLAFLIGQLAQKENMQDVAANYFEMAKNLSNDYTLSFFADLNALKDRYYTDQVSAESTLKEIQKLARDDKNKEFLGYLDYTAGIIQLDQRNYDEAKKFFEKALNSPQGSFKLDCYYELASLYYRDDNFVKAKNYYDSTLSVINESDDRFATVKERSENLTEIASLLEVIQEQDSLLYISQLSDDERKELAKKIKKQRELERLRAFNSAIKNRNTATSGSDKTSNFFAYSEKSVKKGKKEFERKFNDIPLVDNWRYASLIDGITSKKGEEDITASTSINDIELENIFENVPETPEEIAASKNKIKEALPDLGFQYRDILQRNDLTIETLEGRLLKEYDSIDEEPKVYYYLYLAYTDESKPTQAEKYKNLLIKQYPNSKYTKNIVNPGGGEEENTDLENNYEQAYSLFQNEKPKQAKALIDQATKNLAPAHSMMPKFLLLNALCVGKLNGEKAYKAALNTVASNYPLNAEGIRAKEILRILDNPSASISTPNNPMVSDDRATASTNNDVLEDSPFSENDSEKHYAMLILENDKANVNEIQTNLSKLNRKTSEFQKLRVTKLYLQGEPLVIVRDFDNKEKALQYYQHLAKSTGEISEDQPFKLFVIARSNYQTILRQRNTRGYEAFFQQIYLN